MTKRDSRRKTRASRKAKPRVGCSVCAHADRDMIDRELAAGSSVRDVEEMHEGVSKSALERHRRHASRAPRMGPSKPETRSAIASAVGLTARLHASIEARLLALEEDPNITEYHRAKALASLSSAAASLRKSLGHGLSEPEVVKLPAFKRVTEALARALAPFGKEPMLAVAAELRRCEAGLEPDPPESTAALPQAAPETP